MKNSLIYYCNSLAKFSENFLMNRWNLYSQKFCTTFLEAQLLESNESPINQNQFNQKIQFQIFVQIRFPDLIKEKVQSMKNPIILSKLFSS